MACGGSCVLLDSILVDMSLKLLSLLILFDISFSLLEITSIKVGYSLFCQCVSFCLSLPLSSIDNKLKLNTFS